MLKQKLKKKKEKTLYDVNMFVLVLYAKSSKKYHKLNTLQQLQIHKLTNSRKIHVARVEQIKKVFFLGH